MDIFDTIRIKDKKGIKLNKKLDNISNEFAAKLTFHMYKNKITGEELSKKMSVSSGAIYNWKNGNRFPNDILKIYELADILGISVLDLLPYSLEEKKKIVKNALTEDLEEYQDLLPKDILPYSVKKISLQNGYVGAGSSGIIDTQELVDEIYVDINTIARKYRDDDIKGLQVVGDSMIPYIDAGDIILYTLIDNNFPKIDGKYIINIDNNLMIKNIKFKINGDIIISSENKAYSDDIIKADSQEQNYFSIVGIAVGRILKQ